MAAELTDAGWAVGLVYFAGVGPQLLAPIGGALADRFDRARIVAWSRLGTAALAALLAVLWFGDLLNFPILLAVTAVAGVVGSAEGPAQASLLPNTVPFPALLSALTLASVLEYGSRVVGPIAGPLMGFLGPGWVFAGAAIMLGLAAWQMSRMTVRSSGGIHGVGGGLWVEARWIMLDAARYVRGGLRYLGNAPGLRMLTGLAAAHCMLAMSFEALLIVFVRGPLDGGAEQFGYLMIGIGAGALIATFLLPTVRSAAARGWLLFWSGLASGLTMAIVGLAPNLAVALVGAVLIGASQALFMALATLMLQAVVPDAVRGRVIALYEMTVGVIMSTSILAMGLASDFIDVRILLVAPGMVSAVAIGFAWLRFREVRSLVANGGLLEEAKHLVWLRIRERASA